MASLSISSSAFCLNSTKTCLAQKRSATLPTLQRPIQNLICISPKKKFATLTRISTKGRFVTLRVAAKSKKDPEADETGLPRREGGETGAKFEADDSDLVKQEEEYYARISAERSDAAMAVVWGFYEAINSRDLNALADIIAGTCIFRSFAHGGAFYGRAGTLQFIRSLMETMGKRMMFRIESICGGPELKVAALWHLEWDGVEFPLTKGCTIFSCAKEGPKLLIKDIHEFMESPLKQGNWMLAFLGASNSFFELFPTLAKSILLNSSSISGRIEVLYEQYLKPPVTIMVYPVLKYYNRLIRTILFCLSWLIKMIHGFVRLFQSPK